MNEKIQNLTIDELQSAIDYYLPIAEHNTIIRTIVELYQKELNERLDSFYRLEDEK